MKLLEKVITTISVSAVGLLTIASSAIAGTPQDTLLTYGAALNAGDARAAADVFSADAIFSQAGAPLVTGREAIFANFTGLF